jgi:aspartate racemase
MIALNEKLAALSPEKRALLEARLIGKKNPFEEPRGEQSSPAPLELSFAQKSIWFLDRLEPQSAFYSIPQAMRIKGKLNVEALRKSFQTVIARHKVLRTQIFVEDGQPQPRIASGDEFHLPIVSVAADERENVRDMIDDEAKRPFDLEKDLMLRARLLRLNEREHILLLTVHHIASDLWSFRVLYRELAAFYEAFDRNTEPNLPALPFQYSDFARSQREFLESKNCQAQIEFWRQQLAGDLPELNLPSDHPRPKTQRFRGARQQVRISKEISDALKSLSQKEGVTLFITLFAAFQTLLHRYSGQNDMIIGSPFGGRNRFETEDLIGYFLNTLALRTDLSGDPSFRELLRRSRDTVLGAFSHREIPFEKLVDELRLPRNGNQNPVFQNIFQFQPGGVPILELAGTEVELLESESGTSKMDLIFTLAEDRDGLTGNLEYNTDLFEAITIERMLNHYKRLLRSVLKNPSQKISELELLDDSENEQVVAVWNKTATDYPRNKTIHRLFEEQVAKAPGAIALAFGAQELAYRELNNRANRLARHLVECGVKNDSPVGICLDRSPELIIGILAILKAGGAYVPLDSNLPKERLQLMLDDAAVSIVVTDKDFSFSKARKVHPQNFSDADADLGTAMRNVGCSPENLAYIMFTSGSTGKPKGVAVPHRAVVRLVKETNFMTFSAEDVFLQFAPVSFDASTLEIWGALLNGAKLVIHPPELPSLEELGEALRENKITTLWLTAGLFHEMVEHHIESLRGIKQLLAGGDVLSVSHVKKVLEKFPACQLINGYGPTENTTFTCCYPVPKNWNGQRSVPIGKPISNTQVFILDRYLRPAPIGVPGELFIGGDGLARGYLNAPDLNAEKFITSPFHPDQRLYKTGDNARWLADGNLEFLGRLDHQVKIRGFRIELGEIESAISNHPAVRQSVVVARENSALDKQLLAYFTTEPGVSLAENELQTYLEQTLPHYMMPASFIEVEKFPLTQNGKVDRSRLPAPENSSVPMQIISPRDGMEQTLFKIWSDVLGRNRFGVHENFFQLGGHSLLATRVTSRIAEQFQASVSLREIFEHPTIAGLALALKNISSQNLPQPKLTARRPPRTTSRPGENTALSSENRIENFVSAKDQTHANAL